MTPAKAPDSDRLRNCSISLNASWQILRPILIKRRSGSCALRDSNLSETPYSSRFLAFQKFFRGISWISKYSVVGDWNGDGVDTIGVLLPSNVFGATTFGLNNVNANPTGSFDILAAFGADGDLPVSGDWDFKPANTAPNSGVNNPGNGASAAGEMQTFVTTCSDPDGWHDIATIDFKIARSNGNGQGVPIAIWAQFDENHNLIAYMIRTCRYGVRVRPDRTLCWRTGTFN